MFVLKAQAKRTIPPGEDKTADNTYLQETGTQPPKMEPAAGGRRHVFVYGDGNAFRMKHAALRTAQWNRRVQFRTREAATLQEVVNAVDEAADIWEVPEAMVVIHAGQNDLAQVEPGALVQTLRSQLASWRSRANKHHFVISAVPTAGPEDEVLRQRCGQWNTEMQQACKELGAQVEVVSMGRALQERQQGAPYHADIAEKLGVRMGRRMCAFLSLRPGSRTPHRQEMQLH